MKMEHGIAARAVKTFLLLVTIYLFTLFLFLIDSSRMTFQVKAILDSREFGTQDLRELVEISDDLERYSAALGSPVIYPIELALGDTESIGKVGRALEAGSRALQKLSPLIEDQDANSNLSEIEILSRNALLINKASKEITQVFSEIERINPQGLLSPLKPRVEIVQEELLPLRQVFDRVKPILPILPDLLGAKSKRTYFVGMQNSAQGRGTGGLLGTFAILSIDKGKVELEVVAPNTTLETQPDIPIQVPAEYREIYKDYARNWNGSNFSPHFPYAAQIWAETWRRMTNQQVDGVIAIDTYLLKALLEASGPVDLDGYLIDSKNVIEELLANAYLKFESDPQKRKNFLVDVSKTVAERFISGNYSKSTLILEAIGPILENRVLIYSRYEGEMRYLANSPLSGILEDSPNNEYRLVVQNIAGNKLDYYLDRELTILSEQCAPIRTTRVDFTVTNTADHKKRLPAYVSALRAQGYPLGNKNAQFAGLFLYGPSNSRVTGVVDADTGQTYGSIFTERSRPLYAVQVLIPAGESKSFSVFFEGGEGELSSHLQPLVIPQKTTIVDACKQ